MIDRIDPDHDTRPAQEYLAAIDEADHPNEPPPKQISITDPAVRWTAAKGVIENWRRHYNTVQPHSALGWKPPAPETIVPMDQRPVMH